MYYPPFQGAIDADVGSFMCSYNKINDTWSCENERTLGTDLKVGTSDATPVSFLEEQRKV